MPAVPAAPLKGPPITVTCDCGQRHVLRYGASVDCACGRRYSTSSIPEDEYRAIASTAARFRLVTWGLAALLAALVLLVALTQPPMLLLLVPGALILYFGYLRPLLKRSYRKRIAQFPSWDLKPERPG
jgi:hypothetical protein